MAGLWTSLFVIIVISYAPIATAGNDWIIRNTTNETMPYPVYKAAVGTYGYSVYILGGLGTNDKKRQHDLTVFDAKDNRYH